MHPLYMYIHTSKHPINTLHTPYIHHYIHHYKVPKVVDPFARWETTYYGGLNGPEETSRIVFSNGLLDPWSAAGVRRGRGEN